MNEQDKTMLALAALTYRGFGLQSEAAVDQALSPWLPKMEAEGLGKWNLVWGPAAFRAATSLVDDAMVYVARLDSLPHYAIAIRGTNPVSAFDWVLGDLWIRLQMDWPSAGGAQISASTALGLAIIQHLDTEVPPSTSNRLATVANAVVSALASHKPALPELEPERLLTDPSYLPDEKLLARVRTLTQESDEKRRSRTFQQFIEHLGGRSVMDAIDRHVMDLLLKNIAKTPQRGETLLEFLNRRVERDAVVSVTGHSKGGSLAVATALWLHENWASSHQAQIDCFSFAGPTAGNAAFAKYYNSKLGARTRRIVNRRDIVPQAWVPENLRAVVEFYPALAPAVEAMIPSVGPLHQTHVEAEVVEIAARESPGNLVQKIAYQHLDAYLVDAGFRGPHWTARSLFLGA